MGEIWERNGRDDGRDEKSKIPLFKGLSTVQWERWTLSVNNPSLFINNASLSMLYHSLISANRSLNGNYSFPVWECQIPRLGTKHSQAGK